MILEALLLALPVRGQATAVNDGDAARVTLLQQDIGVVEAAALDLVRPWNEVR
jgi:hypothetical protein